MHFASAGGHVELVELLLEEGASASEEDKEGYTPMHLAARYGHNSIIDILKSKVSLSVVSAKVKRVRLTLLCIIYTWKNHLSINNMRLKDFVNKNVTTVDSLYFSTP